MKRLLILLIIFWISCTALANEHKAFQHYYQGEYSKAQPMLSKLAENNNPKALYFLAKMNLFGYGMMKNTKNGFEYMERAAKLKNLNAQMYLGAYYLHHEKNIKEALVWLKKAANQGNPNAQMFTALCYLNGFGVTKNLDVAKRYIIKSAQNDIPMAQFLLAKMFLKNRHPRDKKMGRIWMLKAAKNHYADAALAYGVMLYTGNNIRTNRTKGTMWIERSIQLGNKNAKAVLTNIQSLGNIGANNNLDKKSALSLQQDAKPQETMIALLKKAGIDITNPKRILAEGDAQTKMPTLQSLSKNTIIEPDFSLVSPNDLPIHYILAHVSNLTYQKQSQKLHVNTYTYVIPKHVKTHQEAFQMLSRQAMYGHTQALFKLALLYENGDGVEKNKEKAFSMFMKAAELNHLKSEYMVGVYYLKGWVVNKNNRIAMQWLRKAALHGNANAQLLLGNIYEYGLHDNDPTQTVKKDLTRARAMYSLAAQNHIPEAQYQLAQMYASGLFNPTNNHKIQNKNLKIAYQLYLNAAKAGMEKAKIYLAYFYAARNESEIKHTYAYNIANKFSAIRNHDAELLLAILYDRGLGVQKNHRAALTIYRSLAKDDNVFANFMLGTYYYLHDKNNQRAKDYLVKAAEQGIAYAQYNLAIIAKNNHQLDSEFLLLLNKAIKRDFNKAHLLLADYYLINQSDSLAMKKAVHIYQRLSKKQDPRAELKLGYMYQKGIYFSKDTKKAFYWYQQSANHGNKIAQYQLGEMYLLGQGVKRNIKLALNYYKKSAEQQFEPAMIAIGYIKSVVQFDYENAKKWYLQSQKSQASITNVNSQALSLDTFLRRL
jgi:enhanced entry protein EnhC